MKNPTWEKSLQEKYLAGYNIYTQSSGIVCDGISEEGVYTLLFLTHDINKASKFLIDTIQNPDNRYRIICYEYQSEIKELFGKNVEIITIPDKS